MTELQDGPAPCPRCGGGEKVHGKTRLGRPYCAVDAAGKRTHHKTEMGAEVSALDRPKPVLVYCDQDKEPCLVIGAPKAETPAPANGTAGGKVAKAPRKKRAPREPKPDRPKQRTAVTLSNDKHGRTFLLRFRPGAYGVVIASQMEKARAELCGGECCEGIAGTSGPQVQPDGVTVTLAATDTGAAVAVEGAAT